MKKLFKNPVVTTCCVILLFSVSCSKDHTPKKPAKTISNSHEGIWQQNNEFPVQFKAEISIGDNKELLFPQTYKMEGPVADKNGNIYVIDGEKGTMYSFDSTGTIQWQKGSKGKGPGDFSRPQGLIINEPFLYTSNVQGTRIDKFDLNGNLVDNHALPEGESFTSVEGMINDSLLIITSSTWGEAGVHIRALNINNNYTVSSDFKVRADPPLELGKGLSFKLNVTVFDSLISVGNTGNYALQFYDVNGNFLKRVERDFEKLVKPGRYHYGDTRTMGSFGALSAAHPILKDFYLVKLSWPVNVENPDEYLKKSRNEDSNLPEVKYSHALDLYNRRDTLLYSDTQNGSTPEFGEITYVSDDGRTIYTKTNDPYPQIRRYSVQLSTPEKRQ